LKTLEYGPKYIGGSFACRNNPLFLRKIIKFILNLEIVGKIFFESYNLLNYINKNKNDYKKIIRIIFE
jgi:hypothetical protein